MTVTADRAPLGLFPDRPTPRLHDHVLRVMKTRHYSPRTIESYLGWIRRFIVFFDGRHPRELDEEDVAAFLTDLAVNRKVSAATQNQALAAILFLYKHVLEEPLERIDGIARARRPKTMPTVLSHEEAAAILGLLEGTPALVCKLQYGSGLRLMEALELRVKDLDFDRARSSSGTAKATRTVHDAPGRPPRAAQGASAGRARDRTTATSPPGLGRVPLPGALGRKYPNADREWGWQRVFPASSHYRTGTPDASIATTSTSPSSRRPCAGPRTVGIAKRVRPTPSVTPSRHTCSRVVTTSGRSRSSSAIERQDDPDLHACPQPRGPRSQEPPRRVGRLSTLTRPPPRQDPDITEVRPGARRGLG